jgi:hypothetical protein
LATQIQYRRGTAAQNNAFTGALGEVTVDTTNATLRVHDGSTAGGANIATVAYVSAQLASLNANKINKDGSNVTVDTSYVNVAVNGSNVFSFGATQMITTRSIVPSGNATTTLGTLTNQWSTIYGQATTAQYADLAEIYTTDQQYPAGTVVVFGGEAEITQSHSPHDTRIAGVVSSNPAYLMNSTETGLPVALQGRVPCRVLGPVSKGDRVVSSHIAGVAQALDSIHYQPGCIIGKALQAIDSTDISIIEVVVGRL